MISRIYIFLSRRFRYKEYLKYDLECFYDKNVVFIAPEQFMCLYSPRLRTVGRYVATLCLGGDIGLFWMETLLNTTL